MSDKDEGQDRTQEPEDDTEGQYDDTDDVAWVFCEAWTVSLGEG